MCAVVVWCISRFPSPILPALAEGRGRFPDLPSPYRTDLTWLDLLSDLRGPAPIDRNEGRRYTYVEQKRKDIRALYTQLSCVTNLRCSPIRHGCLMHSYWHLGITLIHSALRPAGLRLCRQGWSTSSVSFGSLSSPVGPESWVLGLVYLLSFSLDLRVHYM